MESTIFVAEATAFIEGVHLLKQWIYDGTAQLHIPCRTLTAVQEAHELSITKKDEAKKQENRQSGRQTRKEQPLFDINPRTVMNFVQRAQSEVGVSGVTFQKENEVFTQWKEEEERAARAETPLLPPSSFADALLRKLTIGDQKEEVKGPSKPKLTARNKASNKPAWKIDKVPVIPSEGLSEDTKSVLSYFLWLTYESERNPLQPVKYVLLAHSSDMMKRATALGLATTSVHQTKEMILKDRKEHDSRTVNGELEQQFPEILAMSQAFGTGTPDDLEASSTDFAFLTPQHTDGSALSNDSQTLQSAKTENDQTITSTSTASDAARTVEFSSHAARTVSGESTDESMLTPKTGESSINQLLSSPTSNVIAAQVEIPPQTSLRIDKTSIPAGSTSTAKQNVRDSDDSSELDSDEEIIVFNPRNKRTSGLAGSNSRPGSSGSFVQKTYKNGVQTNSRPTTSSGLLSLDGQIETILLTRENSVVLDNPQTTSSKSEDNFTESSLKTPSESKLKAQSPVFTPGRPFIPNSIPSSAGTESEQASPAFRDSITPPTGPRTPSTPKSHRSVHAKHNGQDLLRIQQENSQRIIQRQRDAIQRQNKTVETDVKSVEQPSPRLIQMEPTDSPTIIDPDAFDRSYVVQPPSKPSTRQQGDKRRPRGNAHRNVKEHTKLRDSAKESPKLNGQVIEPEVEFVLKSGSPRASTRGRGKLWTP